MTRAARRCLAGLTIALALPSALAAAPGRVPSTISVATYVNDPPNTLPAPGGGLTGFDPQLLAAAARAQGVKVRWVRIPSFGKILSDTAGSRVDMAAAAITITPTRRRTLLFGTPITSGNQGLLTRQGAGIISLAELRGRRVAAIPGSTAEATVRAIGGAMLVLLPSPAAVARAVARGAVAAGVGDLSACNWAVRKNPDLSVAATVTQGQVAAWAYPRTEAGRQLRQAMDAGIAAAQRDGTYATLVARWGVARP